MAKPRVYELAKDLNVDSKTVLEKLKDMGEFVKSASSTIEPPVARRLKAAFDRTISDAKPRLCAEACGQAGTAQAGCRCNTSGCRTGCSNSGPAPAGGTSCGSGSRTSQ